MRGLVVIDSPIDLLACCSIRLIVVPSVVFNAEKGFSLRKGEEI